MEWLDVTFGKPTKLIRTMPNTPALVGEGMTALCPNELVSDREMQVVEEIFQSFGKTQVVSEPMIDVVVGVSGSSPAYVFLFIEAMADAAVADGMMRAQAYEFAAQAVLGSAKMVLETGMHPGALKDMVCSPGGTTIEAVRVLEEKGMRSSVFEASKAAVKSTRLIKRPLCSSYCCDILWKRLHLPQTRQAAQSDWRLPHRGNSTSASRRVSYGASKRSSSIFRPSSSGSI